MNYAELLKEKINGSSLENPKEFLSLISGMEAEHLEKLKDSEKKLKSLQKAFGDDEKEYPEKAKRLAEYDSLVEKLEKSTEKINEMDKANKVLLRETALTKQCSALGIDQEALKLLLDDSIEITDEGVLVEGKATSLDKFIEKDTKLSKFKASLYIPKEDSTGATIEDSPVVVKGLPKGKGIDTPVKESDLDGIFNSYLNKYWKDSGEKIKNKFSK